MPLPHFLVLALAIASQIKYILIYFGAFIEGPILMIASGFLLRHNLLSLVPLFAALVLGDLTGDVMWYSLGRFIAEPIITKGGKFFGVNLETFERGKKLFHRYHERILWISKLTLGFGLAVVVLMVAGTMKVSFKKYMFINACGELFLVTALISLGYFFGNVYSSIGGHNKYFFIAGLAIAIVILLYVFGKLMKKKAMELSN